MCVTVILDLISQSLRSVSLPNHASQTSVLNRPQLAFRLPYSGTRYSKAVTSIDARHARHLQAPRAGTKNYNSTLTVHLRRTHILLEGFWVLTASLSIATCVVVHLMTVDNTWREAWQNLGRLICLDLNPCCFFNQQGPPNDLTNLQ